MKGINSIVKRKHKMKQYQKQHGRCTYCGEHFDIKDMTLDHVVARVNGGKTNRGNLKLACRPYNLEKGEMTEVEYRVLRDERRQHGND